MGDTIQRPELLGPTSSRIQAIRDAIGFTVVPGSYYAESGLLAPGSYGKTAVMEFLEKIHALGSTAAIDEWIENNPLPPNVPTAA